jgi:transcriptional regulator with XRE-family HTH domain
MQTRAEAALSKAFEKHGAAAKMARRTGVSAGVLSRLANGEIKQPSLKISLALRDDPEVPIDPEWWLQPASGVEDEDKGAA